jgi:hypothetical protein
MSEIEPPNRDGFSKKHRNLLLASVAIIIFIVILVIPVVPVEYTVTETRTRNLLYDSEVYYLSHAPKFVNVTNQDSVGGSFSVTMNDYSNGFLNGQPTQSLEDTFSQSLYIKAGEARTFNLPENWVLVSPWYSFNYSVIPPSTQENYNETQTKYESVITLIEKSLV